MPRPAQLKRKTSEKRLDSALRTSKSLKPPPSAPQTALTTSPKGELRWQASLDSVAESMGGREAFIDAAAQAGTEDARTFLTLYRSLPAAEQRSITLQDLCLRCDLKATDLVGSMMGSLIIQQNNYALIKSAMARPDIMDANINLALGDSDLALEAQKLQFQIAGFIKGEGKQIVNLTQNVQGTGILSFEDDSHQSTASVKAEGKPVAPSTSEPTPFDADGELVVQPS